jgi:lipopolysaccharide transport system permease protein
MTPTDVRAVAGVVPDRSVTRLQRSQGWAPLNLRELWAHRELLYFLVWGDLKLRYKQTALGATWAVLQPFLTMIVFTIFFGKLAKIPSDGIPYAVFAYTALVPWTYFANALSLSSLSLVRYEKVITKVYFPRLIVPLAAVLAGLVDFAVSFLLLIALMVWYGITPTHAIWTLPLFILFATVTALAVSLWFAALNVQYRDVRYTIPFLTQVWMFLTPVAYAVTLIPEQWQAMYGLNPMVGVVEGFRWSLLARDNPPGIALVVSIAMVLVILVGGLFYFRRMERTFADVL